jgi:hypothetical protein
MKRPAKPAAAAPRMRTLREDDPPSAPIGSTPTTESATAPATPKRRARRTKFVF